MSDITSLNLVFFDQITSIWWDPQFKFVKVEDRNKSSQGTLSRIGLEFEYAAAQVCSFKKKKSGKSFDIIPLKQNRYGEFLAENISTVSTA